jgi:hypothetical protein
LDELVVHAIRGPGWRCCWRRGRRWRRSNRRRRTASRSALGPEALLEEIDAALVVIEGGGVGDEGALLGLRRRSWRGGRRGGVRPGTGSRLPLARSMESRISSAVRRRRSKRQ